MGDAYTPFNPNIDEKEVDNYYQYCTAIPIGWALAQSWNTELVEKAGDMVGSEMEQFHVDLWLAPALIFTEIRFADVTLNTTPKTHMFLVKLRRQ